jgi:glycosyltransferase involved in cell wall biosynthesis
MNEEPLVSVVIPTRGRPELVIRAVRSALSQTYQNLEILVVVDGPDPATVAALEELSEPRVRIIALSENVGGSEARNIGAREARGEWVALLDDDDEWLPEKLKKQMQLLLQSSHKWPIGACRLFLRRSGGYSVMPDRIPFKGEPMSEYLLCRKSFRYGECIIQTSMIVVPKQLLVDSPFTPNLPRYQDWDWLIRISERDGFNIEWVWEPLLIYNLEAGIKRITWHSGWHESMEWACGNSNLTARAFSYFVAVQIAPRFNILRDFRRLPKAVSDVVRFGKFDLRALMYGLLFAGIPNVLRNWAVQTDFLRRKVQVRPCR